MLKLILSRAKRNKTINSYNQCYRLFIVVFHMRKRNIPCYFLNRNLIFFNASNMFSQLSITTNKIKNICEIITKNTKIIAYIRQKVGNIKRLKQYC
jgi:hypothetical protein